MRCHDLARERSARSGCRKHNHGTGPHADDPDHEAEQIEQANATDRVPVVFVHGLWLLPSSWDRWAVLFEEAGYAPLTPG